MKKGKVLEGLFNVLYRVSNFFYILFFLFLIGFEVYSINLMIKVSIPATIFLVLLYCIIDIPYWAIGGKRSFIKAILASIVIVLLLGTFGTYSLIYMIKVVGFPKGVIPVKIGTASDWIGYAGSILGGSMTMLAVVFTLKFESERFDKEMKQRDLELMLKIQPNVNCMSNTKTISPKPSKNLINSVINQIDSENFGIEQLDSITFTNSSSNPALQFMITSFSFDVFDHNFNVITKPLISDKSPQLIKKSMSPSESVNIPLGLSLDYEKVIGIVDTPKLVITHITYSYTDLLEKHTYEKTFELHTQVLPRKGTNFYRYLD